MPPLPVPEAKRNFLLGLLPPAVHARLEHCLIPVRLEIGDVLIEAGEPIDAVYFPIDAVVSLDQTVSDETVEAAVTASVALAGSEGVVGFEVLLGGQTAINRATVRLAGSAWQIDADALREEFARGTAMQRVLLRATDALVAQIAGTAVCERLHTTAQRLVRWLLLTDDRANFRFQGQGQTMTTSLARTKGVRSCGLAYLSSPM